MSTATKIEWADATWNPVSGCTRVSDGCLNCYIERTPPFRMIGRKFDGPGIGGTTGVLLHEDRLSQPLRMRKPRRIFVCSLADLFHADVSTEFIAQVWAVMALSERHTFQVLTKRPARMRSLLSSERFVTAVGEAAERLWHGPGWHHATATQWPGWPVPNVWAGVSAEDQKRADERIPILLDTPAVVRWVSAEPLLGPVDLDEWLWKDDGSACGDPDHCSPVCPDGRLGWTVVGGESGPGARPMDLAWAEQIVQQCQRVGVPVLVKQLGSAGRRKRHHDIETFPVALRVREYPTTERTVP